jgi:uncharacterized protein (UPF0128 family)
MSETSEKIIKSRDSKIRLPKGSYGYRLFDREELSRSGELLRGARKNYSPWHYRGELYDINRVKLEVPDNKTLLRNMENNNWNQVLKCSQGFIPFEKGAILL